MIRFALRGMLARKLRTVLTAIGVVLGVSLISGTYVLTDSITSAFDSIFSESYRGTDAAITGKAPFELGDEAGAPPPFDQSLLAVVQKLPEVEVAEGSVAGLVQMIGRDGKVMASGGAPPVAFSLDPDRTELNPLTLTAGAWPGTDEIVIDTNTAQGQEFRPGDMIGVQARGAIERLRISGLIEFRGVSSIGDATMAGFDLPTAQRLMDKKGKLDQILLIAKDGVSPQQLQDAVRPVLPESTQVRTADEQAAEDARGTDEFLSFFRTFLLVFGGIALFVGSFVIANSLSITVAQRTREFATLRTLGASRRQVLGTVVLEAVVTGVVASSAGLFLGLGIASGLFALFDAVGFGMPNDGLVFRGRTVLLALLIGVLVTVLASLRPAVRATRVPPIAAVREGAIVLPSRFHRFRAAGAALLAVAGVALTVAALFVDGLSTTALLLMLMAGVLCVFVGIALFSSRLVRPLAAVADPVARWAVTALSVLAWPLSVLLWLPRRLIRGAEAELPGVRPDRPATTIGGANSRRDPQRTASTAAALMIGLALVTLVATLGTGIIKPFEDAVDRIFTADYAITAQDGFTPLPPAVAESVAGLPGVEAISSVRAGQGRAFDENIFLTAVDTQAPRVLGFDWQDGSQQALAELGATGAIVDDGYAEDHGLKVGSPIAMQTVGGKTLQLVVRGIFQPPPGGSPFGRVTISTTTFDANNPEPGSLYTFLTMSGGVTAANTGALDAALQTFPNANCQDREEFKEAQSAWLTSILNVLYVLLALSVVVSLFGIVNTLVLTVFERTRELGMLRAIGLTRRQVRRMIRHESVITALIGAVLGIALGLGLASLLAARLKEITFAVPGTQLVVFAVVAVLVGLFAAIWPARRAARLDPLEALQYE